MSRLSKLVFVRGLVLLAPLTVCLVMPGVEELSPRPPSRNTNRIRAQRGHGALRFDEIHHDDLDLCWASVLTHSPHSENFDHFEPAGHHLAFTPPNLHPLGAVVLHSSAPVAIDVCSVLSARGPPLHFSL